MRFPIASGWHRLAAAVTAVTLVASTTGCLSTGSVQFQTAAPRKPSISTTAVGGTVVDDQRFGYFQSPALKSLGLESPLLVATAADVEPESTFATPGPFDEQDAARFNIIVRGRRPFFSDPIQVGGAALVMALLVSFVSGSSCPTMAESIGRCGS